MNNQRLNAIDDEKTSLLRRAIQAENELKKLQLMKVEESKCSVIEAEYTAKLNGLSEQYEDLRTSYQDSEQELKSCRDANMKYTSLLVQYDEKCRSFKQLQEDSVSRIVYQELKEAYVQRINELQNELEVSSHTIKLLENSIQDLEFHMKTLTSSKESVQLAVEKVIQENNQLKDQLFYNYVHSNSTNTGAATSTTTADKLPAVESAHDTFSPSAVKLPKINSNIHSTAYTPIKRHGK